MHVIRTKNNIQVKYVCTNSTSDGQNIFCMDGDRLDSLLISKLGLNELITTFIENTCSFGALYGTMEEGEELTCQPTI